MALGSACNQYLSREGEPRLGALQHRSRRGQRDPGLDIADPVKCVLIGKIVFPWWDKDQEEGFVPVPLRCAGEA